MTHKSQTISAILITWNHAATLERVLLSLQWTDEIIIFDQGSTDNTLSIARQFTDKIYFHPAENLTLIRRDACLTASSDWLFRIEPDEWVEEMLRHEIDGLLTNAPVHINGYRVRRRLQFQNEWIKVPLFEEETWMLRLVRKNQWSIQEDWAATLQVNGNIGKLDRLLGYAPYQTIEALFQDINQRSTLAAYRYLETKGFTQARCGMIHLLFKTKLMAWDQWIWKGALWRGLTGHTLAMANTLGFFLKWVKIQALIGK